MMRTTPILTRWALPAVLLACAVWVSLPMAALAQRGGYGGGHDGYRGGFRGARGPQPQGDPQQRQALREQRRAEMQSRLGLNQAQMERLQAIREQAKAEAQPLKQQIQQKRAEQQRMMSGGDYDESRAMRLNEEINQMQSRLGELRIRTLGQMKGQMTPEQYTQFSQMRSQARERMQERRAQPGGGSRQGFSGPRMRGSNMNGPMGRGHGGDDF